MTEWNGTDRRGDLPGRRFTDLATCPFHNEQREEIHQLWGRADNAVTKEELKEVRVTIGGKLDRWVFGLFVTSISVLIILAGSIFGYVALDAIESSKNIAILQVNQQKLLRFFDIKPVEDPAIARDIIKKESNDK